MIPQTTSTKVYWYGPYEGYELRSQRRLKSDLGVDQAAADTIIHLRRQILELQSHIRQVEAELAAQYDDQHTRLARYRKAFYEASWIELEFQE